MIFGERTTFGGDGTTTNSQSCATCDADYTGQTNLFKFVAGLNPVDPTSRFTLAIAAVPGQPGQKNLSFNPVFAGRTYTIKANSPLTGPTWNPITGSTPIDTGTTRTIMDLSASGAKKFYHVEISKP